MAILTSYSQNVHVSSICTYFPSTLKLEKREYPLFPHLWPFNRSLIIVCNPIQDIVSVREVLINSVWKLKCILGLNTTYITGWVCYGCSNCFLNLPSNFTNSKGMLGFFVCTKIVGFGVDLNKFTKWLFRTFFSKSFLDSLYTYIFK